MDIMSISQLRSNSKRFRLLLERLLDSTGAEDVFRKEEGKLRAHLEDLGLEDGLISTIINQLGHHGFKKFFLSYNSYNIFQEKPEKITSETVRALALSELISMPIIFMDDSLDSHEMRNGRKTPYGYLSRRYPGRGKEYTIFYANIILNHFLSELLGVKRGWKKSEALLKVYVDCLNRTFLSPTYEHSVIPNDFDQVLYIYKKKSYHFTTRFASEVGSALAGRAIKSGSSLEKVLLGLTYMVSLKNDVFDFFGSGRAALEDTVSHSNTFGLYLLKKAMGHDRDVCMALENDDRERVLGILGSKESKKEMMRRAVQLWSSISSAIKSRKGAKSEWFSNYGLYSDFLLKDLLDNMKHVQ